MRGTWAPVSLFDVILWMSVIIGHEEEKEKLRSFCVPGADTIICILVALHTDFHVKPLRSEMLAGFVG